MSEKQTFYSISSSREAVIKVKRSTFICRIQPVNSLEQAKAFISKISKENKNATHNCWAYILGDNADVFHSSDAGEPSGTAGKPMLNKLHSCGLTQVAVVVTRFYGGVKLGVRGLIEAYSESVKSAIDLAPLKKLVNLVCIEIDLGYDLNDVVMAKIEPMINQIISTDYGASVKHRIAVEFDQLERVEKMLSNYQSSGKLTFKPPQDC